MSCVPFALWTNTADRATSSGKDKWILDEDAAQIVKRVFDLCIDGKGPEQISRILERDQVLTTKALYASRKGKPMPKNPYGWSDQSIVEILERQEYTGCTCNFKTYSKSYKNKKRIHNDPENWVVFQNVHEPIIERAVFEQVQQKRGKMRKRRTSNGVHNMFSGLLVCADCGCNLHFHFNQGNPEIKYFNCSNYKGNRGTCQSTHYIRVDFLEEVVLGEIRRLTKFASLYEDDFLKAVIGHSQQSDEADRKLKEKELKALLARDEELDGLFERIYEDNVSGKISDERFSRMSRRYEDEQKELTEKIKQLRAEIEKQSSRTMTTDMFISLVRKYTRAKKLTPRMLNELVELMVDTVCSRRETIRIAGDDYPAEVVKSRFLKLNSSHIEFVFDCISKNTTEIRNIKKYLLAVLFNAPSTINGHYTALVAHDMNTGKI